MLRAQQSVLLLRPLTLAIPWGPLALAAALATLILLPALLDDPAPYAALLELRLAAVLLGAGASFAMTDRMAPTVVPATPRWLRQWLRLVIVVVPATLAWLALHSIAVVVLGADATAPAGDLAVEALVCGFTGVAGSAVAARYRHTSTGALAGPMTQFTLVAVTFFVDKQSSPWLPPGSSNWSTVHRYWLLGLPIIGLTLLLVNRDTWPLRHRLLACLPHRTGGPHRIRS